MTSKKKLVEQAVSAGTFGLIAGFKQTCPVSLVHLIEEDTVKAKFLELSRMAYGKIYSRKELKIIIKDGDKGLRVLAIVAHRAKEIDEHFTVQGLLFGAWMQEEGYLDLASMALPESTEQLH